MEVLEKQTIKTKIKKGNNIKDVIEGTKFSSMQELTKINPHFFTSRFLIYVGITCLGILGCIYGGILLKILSVITLGFMYAHAIELQHQALHYTAYKSKKLNRVVGVFLGIPMLVSFTDYQVHHWSHHKNLGTEENKEFFNYSYEKLHSLLFLLPHLLMVYHYADVAKWITLSLTGKVKPNIVKNKATDIREEYLIIFAVIVATVALSIYFESTLALLIWALPLVIAIPVHALIELPEHLGCPQLSTDPFHNTRTIQSTWLGKWFTNYNNYHVEHHFLPGVPNDKAYELHLAIKDRIVVLESSFANFYWWFLKELINGGKFESFKKNKEIDHVELVEN